LLVSVPLDKDSTALIVQRVADMDVVVGENQPDDEERVSNNIYLFLCLELKNKTGNALFILCSTDFFLFLNYNYFY
jgi:hypothetical protein